MAEQRDFRHCSRGDVGQEFQEQFIIEPAYSVDRELDGLRNSWNQAGFYHFELRSEYCLRI